MSAIVDIVLAEYTDVLKIPVAAIVESQEGFLCWVKDESGAKKRLIELGDTNDEVTVVTAGLVGGEEVVLNPTALLDEAQVEAMKMAAAQPPSDEGLKDLGSKDPAAEEDKKTLEALLREYGSELGSIRKAR